MNQEDYERAMDALFAELERGREEDLVPAATRWPPDVFVPFRSEDEAERQ